MLFRVRFFAVAGAAATITLLSFAGQAQARTCTVAVSLEEEVSLASLTVRVNYQSGHFVDIHGGCTNVMPDSLGSFGVNAQASRLNLSFISISGMQGPHDLAYCQFEDADDNLTLEDFVVTVLEATDTNDEAVDAAVSVSLPDCGDVQTTTTTSSTTTSTLDLPARTCDVTFRLNGANTILALDWQILYPNASGEFAGSAGGVECDTLPAGTLASYNDIEAQRKVLAALINPTGFATPAAIATCRFIPVGDDPVASDFQVSAKKATNGDVEDIVPVPTISVSKIECSSGEEPEHTCGDANEDGSVLAGDSLLILQNAVGADVDCPLVVCDTDDNGVVLASDSLRTLQSAVGQTVELICPLL
ncbi:MAG TPA: hypothetical protein VEC57_05465 [Candidatus Limnocylindrales bacterium]|nr:hypothetical protein [Candidatus Limnocylindrales bacterium]